MADAYGMFTLGAEDAMRQKQIAAQQAQAGNYARLSPQQQSSYNMSMGAQMVGQGVGDLARHGVGMFTGQDTSNPQEKLARMRAQLQQEMRGIDPSDYMQSYPILIRVLQQHGMIAEAQRAVKEFEELKLKGEDRDIKRADNERRTLADRNRESLAKAKMELADPNSILRGLVDTLTGLYTKRDALLEGSPERKNLEEAIKVATAKLQNKSNGSIKLADQGANWEVLDPNTGDTIRIIPKAMTPKQTDDKQTKDAQQEAAKGRIEANLTRLTKLYEDLNTIGAAVNAARSPVMNIIARARNSAAGQMVEGALGTTAQAIRDEIENIRPVMMNDLRQSSDMSARNMDATKELEFFLLAATDVTKEITSNIAAINSFSRGYGSNKTYSINWNKKAPEGRGASAPRSDPPQPPGGSSGALGTRENPHRPNTRAEYDAVPAGEYWYKNSTKTVERK